MKEETEWKIKSWWMKTLFSLALFWAVVDTLYFLGAFIYSLFIGL